MGTRGLRALVVLAAAGHLLLPRCAAAAAAAPPPPPNKLTVAFYDFASGVTGEDANLRHTWPSSTAWGGVYRQSDGFTQVRLGYEYDYRRGWLTLIPSAQVATHGFAGATVYGEAGGSLYAIAGAGRTNLHPYWNLGFDPNDYAQLGAGFRDAAGSGASIFTIHDVRLGTGQTNMHMVVRRYLPHHWRVTVDAVRERGMGDEGVRIRSWAASLDVDWRAWFVRVAEDPHVNYTPDRQLRIAGGVRF